MSLRLSIVACILALLLFPMYRERWRYLGDSAQWGRENLSAYAKEAKDIEPILDFVQQQGGRVHAGRAGSWGHKFLIGYRPVYSYLESRNVPCTSFLYYGGSLAANMMYLMDEFDGRDLRLFGVRWVIAPSSVGQPSGTNLVRIAGRFRLYEVPQAGMFDTISPPRKLEGGGIFEAGKNWLARRATPLRDASTYVALYPADAPRTGYLLYRSAFHPGLRAKIGGRTVRPVMVTPGFPAFPVRPGETEARRIYYSAEAKPFLLGFCCVALVFLGFLAIRSRSWEDVAAKRLENKEKL